MLAQLTLPVLSGLGGIAAGLIETWIDSKRQEKKDAIEAERDKWLADKGTVKDFYEYLDRSDDPTYREWSYSLF